MSNTLWRLIEENSPTPFHILKRKLHSTFWKCLTFVRWIYHFDWCQGLNRNASTTYLWIILSTRGKRVLFLKRLIRFKIFHACKRKSVKLTIHAYCRKIKSKWINSVCDDFHFTSKILYLFEPDSFLYWNQIIFVETNFDWNLATSKSGKIFSILTLLKYNINRIKVI